MLQSRTVWVQSMENNFCFFWEIAQLSWDCVLFSCHKIITCSGAWYMSLKKTKLIQNNSPKEIIILEDKIAAFHLYTIIVYWSQPPFPFLGPLLAIFNSSFLSQVCQRTVSWPIYWLILAAYSPPSSLIKMEKEKGGCHDLAYLTDWSSWCIGSTVREKCVFPICSCLSSHLKDLDTEKAGHRKISQASSTSSCAHPPDWPNIPNGWVCKSSEKTAQQ